MRAGYSQGRVSGVGGQAMTLRSIPCVLMRGGTSKALCFRMADLPADARVRDRVLLAALGSPDLRQIDGLGGGDEQTSKIVLVSQSQRLGIDVEFLFAQVSVARDVVDTRPNSGNMLAAVGPFAIEHGMVEAKDPLTRVRIFDRNTGRVVEADVPTPQRRVTYSGDFVLDGVPGTSAGIALNFLDPAGGQTGRLLPSGNVIDEVDGIPATCMDFGNPIVMFAAADVGKTGYESKEELDADDGWRKRMEVLRADAAGRMGMGNVSGLGLPKFVILAEPRQGGTITSRYFSPERCHTAHALTGAVCVAAACNIPGSVAARIANPDGAALESVVIEHPSGRLAASVPIDARTAQGIPIISRATVITSARPLFTGSAFVRDAAFQSNDGSY